MQASGAYSPVCNSFGGAGERYAHHESSCTIRLLENNVQAEVYEFTNDLNALIEQMLPCRVFLASRFHSAVSGGRYQKPAWLFFPTIP